MLSLIEYNSTFTKAIKLLHEHKGCMIISKSSKVHYFRDDNRVKSRLGYTPCFTEILNKWEVYKFERSNS